MASMPHNPSDIVPPTEAEAKNAALAKAAYEVKYIRDRVIDGHDVDDGDIVDALEAILGLVAPHWRGL